MASIKETAKSTITALTLALTPYFSEVLPYGGKTPITYAHPLEQQKPIQEPTPAKILEKSLDSSRLTPESPALSNIHNDALVEIDENEAVYLATGGFVWGDTDFRPEEGLVYLVLATGKGELAVSHLTPEQYYLQRLHGPKVNRKNLLDNVHDALHKSGNKRVQIILADLTKTTYKVLEANKENIPADLDPDSIPEHVVAINEATNIGPVGMRNAKAETDQSVLPQTRVIEKLTSASAQDMSPGQLLESRLDSSQLVEEPAAWNNQLDHLIMPLKNLTGYVATGRAVLGEKAFEPQKGLLYIFLASGKNELALSHLVPEQYYAQQLNGPAVNRTNFLTNIKDALYKHGNDRVIVVLVDTEDTAIRTIEANKVNITADLALDSIPEKLVSFNPTVNIETVENSNTTGVSQEVTTISQETDTQQQTLTQAKVVEKLSSANMQELSDTQIFESRLDSSQSSEEPEAWSNKHDNVVIPLEYGSVSLSAGRFTLGEANFKSEEGLVYLVLATGQGELAVSNLTPEQYYAQQLNGEAVNRTNFLTNIKDALYKYGNKRVKIVLVDLPEANYRVYEANKDNVPTDLAIDKIPENLTPITNTTNINNVSVNKTEQPQSPQVKEVKTPLVGLPQELDRVVSVEGSYPTGGHTTLTDKETTFALQPGNVKVVIGGHYEATSASQKLDNSQWKKGQVYITLFRADDPREVKLTNYPTGHVITFNVHSDKVSPEYLKALVKDAINNGMSPIVSMYQTGKDNYLATFDGNTWQRIK